LAQARPASSVVVQIPAVTDSSGEVLSVAVGWGAGGPLVIRGPSSVENDTLGSIWTSLFVANIFSSSAQWEESFIVEFPGGLESVGGPSASLGLSLAFLKLMNGDAANELSNYSVTGAININGLSVAVGGMEAKYNATARKGLAGMALPLSNYQSMLSREANLLPISSLLQLYLLSLGQATVFEPREELLGGYPKELKSYLETVYQLFKEMAAGGDETAQSYLDLADRAYGEGRLYAAASLAFAAYASYSSALISSAQRDEAAALYHELSEKIELMRGKLGELERDKVRERVGLYDLELLSLAESRLWMCESLLSDFEASGMSDLNSLAQAKARCLTAELWINATSVGIEGQPILDTGRMNRALSLYLSYMEKVLRYVESLAAKMTPSGEIEEYLGRLNELYALITENEQTWALPLKLGLTVELAQAVASFLDAFNNGSEELARAFTVELFRGWYHLLARVRLYGLDSVVSEMYAEYSLFMRGKDDSVAYRLASQALLALYPLVIYTKALPEAGQPVAEIEGSCLTRPEPLTHVYVAYVAGVAVAAFALGFLARGRAGRGRVEAAGKLE